MKGTFADHKGPKMTTIHSWSQIQSQLRNPNNPVVFLDVAVGATEIGRIMIGKFYKLKKLIYHKLLLRTVR